MFCSAIIVVYIVMFHWLLQLSYWHESSACDVCCPPGFEPLEMKSDDYSQPTIMSSLAHVIFKPSEQMSSSSSDYMHEDTKCMIKTVENELHFFAKVALSEDIEHLIEDEVQKIVESSENSKLHKVT